jgi:DNA-binding transcriptional ArsR family regulator
MPERMNQPLHRFKAELFKTLGHPLRIRILELLRNGEVSVRDLLRELEVEASTASQQFGILRARGIVDSRRGEGTVYYRIRDPLITDLLDVGRRVFGKHVLDLQQMLDAQEREEGGTRARRARRARHTGRTAVRRQSSR